MIGGIGPTGEGPARPVVRREERPFGPWGFPLVWDDEVPNPIVGVLPHKKIVTQPVMGRQSTGWQPGRTWSL